MGNYTPEQIERRANHFEKAGILDIAAMLRAYAATLRQQAGRVDEAGYVFLCSNPACRAVHIRDPHGPCHVCLAGNGGGWSTTRQRLYRNGPDRYSTEEEGEAYMEGWFDGQAALAQNTQGDGEAVAEIGMYWDLRYFGNEPISKIVERTGAKIGDKLYLHAERARVPVGIEAAIAHIQQKAEAYAEEHCGVEWDTGATTYHHGQAGEEYHHGLLELVDELQAIAAAPSQAKDAGKPAHCCPEWDYMTVKPGDPEMDACTCTFATTQPEDADHGK